MIKDNIVTLDIEKAKEYLGDFVKDTVPYNQEKEICRTKILPMHGPVFRQAFEDGKWGTKNYSNKVAKQKIRNNIIKNIFSEYDLLRVGEYSAALKSQESGDSSKIEQSENNFVNRYYYLMNLFNIYASIASEEDIYEFKKTIIYDSNKLKPIGYLFRDTEKYIQKMKRYEKITDIHIDPTYYDIIMDLCDNLMSEEISEKSKELIDFLYEEYNKKIPQILRDEIRFATSTEIREEKQKKLRQAESDAMKFLGSAYLCKEVMENIIYRKEEDPSAIEKRNEEVAAQRERRNAAKLEWDKKDKSERSEKFEEPEWVEQELELEEESIIEVRKSNLIENLSNYLKTLNEELKIESYKNLQGNIEVTDEKEAAAIVNRIYAGKSFDYLVLFKVILFASLLGGNQDRKNFLDILKTHNVPESITSGTFKTKLKLNVSKLLEGELQEDYQTIRLSSEEEINKTDPTELGLETKRGRIQKMKQYSRLQSVYNNINQEKFLSPEDEKEIEGICRGFVKEGKGDFYKVLEICADSIVRVLTEKYNLDEASLSIGQGKHILSGKNTFRLDSAWWKTILIEWPAFYLRPGNLSIEAPDPVKKGKEIVSEILQSSGRADAGTENIVNGIFPKVGGLLDYNALIKFRKATGENEKELGEYFSFTTLSEKERDDTFLEDSFDSIKLDIGYKIIIKVGIEVFNIFFASRVDLEQLKKIRPINAFYGYVLSEMAYYTHKKEKKQANQDKLWFGDRFSELKNNILFILSKKAKTYKYGSEEIKAEKYSLYDNLIKDADYTRIALQNLSEDSAEEKKEEKEENREEEFDEDFEDPHYKRRKIIDLELAPFQYNLYIHLGRNFKKVFYYIWTHPWTWPKKFVGTLDIVSESKQKQIYVRDERKYRIATLLSAPKSIIKQINDSLEGVDVKYSVKLLLNLLEELEKIKEKYNFDDYELHRYNELDEIFRERYAVLNEHPETNGTCYVLLYYPKEKTEKILNSLFIKDTLEFARNWDEKYVYHVYDKHSDIEDFCSSLVFNYENKDVRNADAIRELLGYEERSKRDWFNDFTIGLSTNYKKDTAGSVDPLKTETQQALSKEQTQFLISYFEEIAAYVVTLFLEQKKSKNLNNEITDLNTEDLQKSLKETVIHLRMNGLRQIIIEYLEKESLDKFKAKYRDFWFYSEKDYKWNAEGKNTLALIELYNFINNKETTTEDTDENTEQEMTGELDWQNDENLELEDEEETPAEKITKEKEKVEREKILAATKVGNTITNDEISGEEIEVDETVPTPEGLPPKPVKLGGSATKPKSSTRSTKKSTVTENIFNEPKLKIRNSSGNDFYNISNRTEDDASELIGLMDEFIPYSKEYLGYDKPVNVVLDHPEDYRDPFAPTGQYDPNTSTIVVFIQGRHPKDILRSLGHELVHHQQNCKGMFVPNLMGDGAVEGYAQKNKHLRKMEEEANSTMMFRDFENGRKKTLRENKIKRIKNVLKEIKNGR